MKFCLLHIFTWIKYTCIYIYMAACNSLRSAPLRSTSWVVISLRRSWRQSATAKSLPMVRACRSWWRQSALLIAWAWVWMTSNPIQQLLAGEPIEFATFGLGGSVGRQMSHFKEICFVFTYPNHWVWLHIYVYAYLHIYTYVYIYIYICIYIYIDTCHCGSNPQTTRTFVSISSSV